MKAADNQTDTFPKKLIFFDGYCNLCNASVDFLIRKDHKKTLRYASLQGTTAKKLIPMLSKDLNTIVYVKSNPKRNIYTKSSAAIRVVYDLGGWRSLIIIFLLVPPVIRNLFYNWIAKNRFKWYGKKETCRIPTKEEQEMFLD